MAAKTSVSPLKGEKVVNERRPRGFISSVKNGREMPFWRYIERDFMWILEVDGRVHRYDVRPEVIWVRHDNGARKHRIDFQVVTADSIVMVDLVKSAPDTELTDAIAGHYFRSGIRYQALPHDIVRAEPRLSNAVELLRSRALVPSTQLDLAIRQALTRGCRTLEELEAALGDWSPARFWVYAAALRSRVRLDLSKPLCGSTPVSLA